MPEKPMLGFATNEDLMRELIARFSIDAISSNLNAFGQINRIVILSEMLGGMDATNREYRTVDS